MAEADMIEIRKIITMREAIFSELGVAAARPTIRAVGMVVIRNPFAGKFVEDLKALLGQPSPMAKARSSA